MEDGAGGGGDEADIFRERGQGTLSGGVEEAFAFEGLLESLEFEGEGADAFGDDYVGDEIEGAADFVEGHAAVGGDGCAVGEEIDTGAPSEHNAVKLAVGVFQGEVGVAGLRHAEV